MNIGCLFGTFDPPHTGHLRLAVWMRSHQDLDEVWFVVSPQNPFKTDRQLSPEQDRLRMVELIVEGQEGLRTCDIEMELPRPSFTAHTLQRLRQLHPEHRFSLLMGGDNLRGFHRWREPGDILAHHRVLVYPRPDPEGDEMTADVQHPPQVVLTEAPLMDLSSTWIRNELRAGGDTGGLVPPAVLDYIRKRGLYTA